jgi:hypothetical protein
MTLLERCKQLRSQIEQRNALRKAHKDAEAFRERSGEIRVTRTDLAADLARLAVLRGKLVNVPKPPAASAAMAVLEECRTGLVTNPAETGKDFGRLKRAVDKVGKDVELVVDRALEGVKRDLPNIEESFLKQVELIPAYSHQVTRIRQERDGLLAGLDLRSRNAIELEAFLDKREALRSLADQLDPKEFPKEVLEFFKSARRSGGAPLEKLTDTVRSWLAERDQLKNIRIVVN